jgi:rubredoxin
MEKSQQHVGIACGIEDLYEVISENITCPSCNEKKIELLLSYTLYVLPIQE